jgi:hypothetical protein
MTAADVAPVDIVEHGRVALDQLAPLGPQGAALLAHLRAVLDARQSPDDPIRRRADAVQALAAFYSGSTRRVAVDMARDLGRYETGPWKRDKHAARSPYQTGSTLDLKFRVMRNSRAAPGIETVRKILRPDLVDKKSTLEITHSGAQRDSTKRIEAPAVNAPANVPALPVARVIEAFALSPTGQQIAAESHAATVRSRQEIRDALDALDAQAEKELPRVRKAQDDAIAAVREGERKLRALNDALNRASAAVSAGAHAYSHERARLEGLLRDLPEKAQIDEFLRAMLDELDATRRKIEVETSVITDRLTGKKTERRINNKSSIDARVAAIRAAMEEAEGLALIADPSTIPARLEALRASIPEIGPPQEIQRKDIPEHKLISEFLDEIREVFNKAVIRGDTARCDAVRDILHAAQELIFADPGDIAAHIKALRASVPKK